MSVRSFLLIAFMMMLVGGLQRSFKSKNTAQQKETGKLAVSSDPSEVRLAPPPIRNREQEKVSEIFGVPELQEKLRRVVQSGTKREQLVILRQLQQAEKKKQAGDERRAEEEGLITTEEGVVLRGFEDGLPRYRTNFDLNAGISTGANLLRLQTTVGDPDPYGLDGDGVTMGIWEVGGVPRTSHLALAGRIELRENASSAAQHATLVAGVMVSNGQLNSSALGMAPAGQLDAYDSISDTAEMMVAYAAEEGSATDIYLSNHSYGSISGWRRTDAGDYQWYGVYFDNTSQSDDYSFSMGHYTTDSRAIDDTLYLKPYGLAFYSAGNDRSDQPPPAGTPWQHRGNATQNYASYDPARHPVADADLIGRGYGTLSDQASAKNVVSIGAINDAVSNGVRDLNRATMSTFSCWGPTDDGRIKPDLVANGVSLIATNSSSDTSFAIASGTSFSAPNAAGTAALLTEYFSELFPGESMRGSMLKALLIHTADDLGIAGPDYQNGWGLINGVAAAEVIRAEAVSTDSSRLIDGRLASGDSTDSLFFTATGTEPIRVTIAWTDPRGPRQGSFSPTDRTPRLVNDLNLRVIGPDGTTSFPYVMPWVGNWTDGTVDLPATRGVNSVDNVEQVYLPTPAAGDYTIEVDFTGDLTGGEQVYSLVVSGGEVAPEVPINTGELSTEHFVEPEVRNLGPVSQFFLSSSDLTYTAESSAPTVVSVSITTGGALQLEALSEGQTTIRLTATNEFGATRERSFAVSFQPIIYVNAANQTGSTDGLTWNTAYTELQTALDEVVSGQEIWLAQGHYRPSSDDPSASFVVPAEVTVRGGFTGGESEASAADPENQPVVLSGDLALDDASFANAAPMAAQIIGTNAETVVSIPADAEVILSGLVITAGDASANGGGILVNAGASLTLINCRVVGNRAASLGGGMHAAGTGALVLEGCQLSGNVASQGGDLFSADASRTVKLSNLSLDGEENRIHLAGEVTLEGILTLIPDPDLVKQKERLFSFLSTALISSNFASTDLPAAPGGFSWQVVDAPASLTLSVTVVDTEEAFRSTYDLAANGDDDQLDLSGNGVPNIHYLAFGLGDPAAQEVDRSRLATTRDDSGQTKLRFVRVKDGANSSLDYRIFASMDLSTWTEVSLLPPDQQIQATEITLIDDQYEQWELTFNQSDTRCFYRLGVVDTSPAPSPVD